MTLYAPFGRLLLATTLSVGALPALALTPDEIDRATFTPAVTAAAPAAAADAKTSAMPSANAETKPETKPAAKKAPDPRVIKAQVLLDRRRLSPGVIDGFDGGNFRKAMAELRRRHQLPEAEALDVAVWGALSADTATDIMTEYTVTAEDAAYAFAPTPKDYADLAKLETIGYRTAAEMIGERFHMDEDLVRALNPTIENWKAGDRLAVVKVRTAMGSLTGNKAKSELRVTHILVERGRGAVTAYDAENQVLAIYPATVGSTDTPTPAGHYTVNGVARNPTYSYRPDVNFKQGENNEKLDSAAWAERAGRLGLDRPVEADLWHPRHARAGHGFQRVLRMAASG